MLHDEEEMDTAALQMKELISKHFETDNELSIWSKDIFKQVAIVFQEKKLTWFQHASSFPRGFLYVSIVAQNQVNSGLSGKYNFHSMKNNKPALIREGGEVPDVPGKNHYLVWYDEYWYIQKDERFLKGEGGGYFCICSSGKFFYKL